MTDWFWKKISQIAGWAALAVLFYLMFFMANIEIKDSDLWLHLATGRFIVEHLQIPRVDILSFSVAGTPWINHEWLFQVLVFLAYHLAGFEGIIYLQVILVAITFSLLVSLGYQRDKQLLPIILLTLVLFVYQLRFTHRPDLFSILFFVLYVYLLATRLQQKSCVFLFFILQALWTNTHGFFILGPFIILLNLTGEWLKRVVPLPFEWKQTGRLDNAEYRRLKQILLVVIGACLLNPHFLKGAWYPFDIILHSAGHPNIFFKQIVELQPPTSWATFWTLKGYLAYKALILISLISFAFNYRRIDIGTFFFWLAFLLFSLKAVRNIPFFAVAAYFVTLINFHSVSLSKFLPEFLRKTGWRAGASFVLKLILIFWMLHYAGKLQWRGYYDFDTHERKSEFGGVSLRIYPYKAVDFLVRNKIKGNFLNDFNSGAYLLGRTFPRIKIFIDGRTEVYGADFFNDYRSIWRGNTDLLDKTIDQLHVSGIFVQYLDNLIPFKLIRHIYQDPHWHLVYFDYDALIFLKDIPENQEWIKNLEVDLTRWEPPLADLNKIGPKKVQPYQFANRAMMLFYLGFYDKARQQSLEAIKINPEYFKPYKVLGRIYLVKEDYARAYEELRKAKLADSGDLETRYYLAVSLAHLNELKEAFNQCQYILRRQPDNAFVWYLLAQIYAQDQQYNKVVPAFEKGLRSDEDKVELMLEVTKVLIKQGQFDLARKLLDQMTDHHPKNREILEQRQKIEGLITPKTDEKY